MISRAVIEWEPLAPFGARAVEVNPAAKAKGKRVSRVLGFVWPRKRKGLVIFWCATDAAGKDMGQFRTEQAAKNRVSLGKVVSGLPVLVRVKG